MNNHSLTKLHLTKMFKHVGLYSQLAWPGAMAENCPLNIWICAEFLNRFWVLVCYKIKAPTLGSRHLCPKLKIQSSQK